MSQAPAMPLFWGDYWSKTRRLSPAQHHAYLFLLGATWMNNCCAFRDDDAVLAQVIGISVKAWKQIRPALVGFFDLSSGTWRNPKLEEVWADVMRRVDANRKNGPLGGRPKKAVETFPAGTPRPPLESFPAEDGKNGNDQQNQQTEKPIGFIPVNPNGNPNGTQTEPIQSQSKEEKGSLARSQKEAPKRRQQVPVDWEPGETGRAFAAEHAGWYGQRLGDEVGHFRDHHRKNGTVFADIEAAWKTWARNGVKYDRNRRPANAKQGSIDNLIEGFGRAAGLGGRPPDREPDRSALGPLLDGKYVRLDA